MELLKFLTATVMMFIIFTIAAGKRDTTRNSKVAEPAPIPSCEDSLRLLLKHTEEQSAALTEGKLRIQKLEKENQLILEEFDRVIVVSANRGVFNNQQVDSLKSSLAGRLH